MSINGNNDRTVGHQSDMRNINDVQVTYINSPRLMGGIGSMCLPLAEGNVVFNIMSTIIITLKIN